MYHLSVRAPSRVFARQLILMMCLLAPARVLAGAPPDDVKPDRTTVSLLGPLMGVEVGRGVVPAGNIHVAGVEATYQAPAQWMLWLGLIYLTDGNEFKPTMHLRGGYAFHLHGARPDTTQRGLRGFGTPFIGYRYAARPFPERDSYSDIYRTHNAQLGGSYEVQWGRRLSALFRLTMTYDVPFAASVESASPAPTRYRGGVSVYTSLGVAGFDLFSRR